MEIEELLQILEMQEEILQFTHFTNADAWELGNLIIQEARRRETPVVLKIRLNNSQTVFQYDSDGTTRYMEEQAEKKIRTVQMLEKSSLRLHMMLRQDEETLESMGLDPAEYSSLGGAFPIRMEEAGVIGVIAATGENHVTDHDLLVKCISRYLHIDEVPRIRAVE